MKRMTFVSLVLALCVSFVLPCMAQTNFVEILKSGLLGAGAGAVGGAASGAKGAEIWKGALAGAGVNVVGGALLDTMTQQTTTVRSQGYYEPQPQTYYARPQRQATYVQAQPVYTTQSLSYEDIYQQAYNAGYNAGYNEGYKAGYKAGYQQGYKDGLRY